MPQVEVTKAHGYKGKRHLVGDVYECPDKWAKVICAVKKAIPHIEVKPKRQYRRRDVTAQKPEEYSRKDMQAED